MGAERLELKGRVQFPEEAMINYKGNTAHRNYVTLKLVAAKLEMLVESVVPNSLRDS